MTTINVQGNLTADPELRYTPNGSPVATFTIAENRRRKDKNTGEWIDGEPNFWRCEAWNELAEHIADSCTKGTRVIAEGTYITERFTDKNTGEERTKHVVKITDLGPSLRYATAHIARAQRTNSNGGQE